MVGLGPARVSYNHEDHGDWSHLVPEVAAAIAGCLVGDRIAAWVNRKTTRRRGDEYYQSMSAWWASSQVVVQIGANRPLTSAGDSRFRPVGPWTGEVVVHQLAPAPISAKTFARRKSGGDDPAVPAPPPRLVHDSMELLPEPLRKVTAGGPPAGSLLWDNGQGQVTEEVMAYRLLTGNAVVLFAWRGPGDRDALESAIWHSRVLEASVVGTRTYSFDTNSPPTSSPSMAPPQPMLDTRTRRILPS